MALLPQLEARRLSASLISVRSQADYREAGGVDAVLRFLRTSNGLIHLAPLGCGTLQAEEVNTFHGIPAVLRSVGGVSEIGAYWLVSHCQFPAPTAEAADYGGEARNAFALGMAGGFVEAVFYSWLFVQPTGYGNSAWHQAGDALSQHFHSRVLCQGRGDSRIKAYVEKQRSLIDCATAEHVMKQIAINAFPTRSLEAFTVISPLGEALMKTSLYAAVPHCNSSKIMFAFRSIWKGDEQLGCEPRQNGFEG